MRIDGVEMPPYYDLPDPLFDTMSDFFWYVGTRCYFSLIDLSEGGHALSISTGMWKRPTFSGFSTADGFFSRNSLVEMSYFCLNSASPSTFLASSARWTVLFSTPTICLATPLPHLLISQGDNSSAGRLHSALFAPQAYSCKIHLQPSRG